MHPLRTDAKQRNDEKYLVRVICVMLRKTVDLATLENVFPLLRIVELLVRRTFCASMDADMI